MSNNKQTYTPMINQYLKIKEDYADAIVFFRLGDFYEMFFDDAIIASKVLEITLTSKDAGKKIPMAGIPHHSSKPYIQKLIANGFKIAIAEQITEPGKGLVEREVIRVITPGTVFEDDILVAKENNYIASIILLEEGYLLTYTDVSTGESYVISKLDKKELTDQIISLKIKEIVLKNDYDKGLIETLKQANIYVSIYKEANSHDNLWASDLEVSDRLGARHLLNYLVNTQKQPLSHLQKIIKLEHKRYMKVSGKVKKQLEIVDSNTNNPKTTLLYHIDFTKTAMGARLLKNQLNNPILDLKELEKRNNLIDAFIPSVPRILVQEVLSYIYDINRIVGKVSFMSVNARDLYQLKETLKNVEPLKNALLQYESNLVKQIALKLNSHEELIELLEKSILEEPSFTIKEGGIIKRGYNKELDELIDINHNSKEWLKKFEEEERDRTGIKTLKVGYNRIFGYFIEISKQANEKIDDSFGYIRKQTLSNSERYISEVLKKKEDIILNAKEKAIKLEYELFIEIRTEVAKNIISLQELSNTIATIDCYISHAVSVSKNNLVKPVFSKDRSVNVVLGRHLVVEKFTDFVANSVNMKKGETFIITGPNMSGKSTYMRMYALIVYMAQIGSYVPATSATLPIYDAIFTRIGAADDISGGKSTFMVEMVESNEALTHATKDSLILFDEIGRGTATYDGMALAQGIIEYISSNIQAQMFFSTHYHELTDLEKKYDNITNLHVKASEEKDKMIFLHQITKGASDKSYGLQVASLANIPKEVIKRSREILNALEKKSKNEKIDLFTYEAKENLDINNRNDDLSLQIIKELEDIDINLMMPLDALVLIKNLQNKIKKK